MRFKELKEDKTAYTTKDHIIYGLWLAHEFLKNEDDLRNETHAHRCFVDHLLSNGLKITQCKIPDRFLQSDVEKTK